MPDGEEQIALFSFRDGEPVYTSEPIAAWRAPVLRVRSARTAAQIAEGDRLPTNGVWRPPFPESLDDYSEHDAARLAVGEAMRVRDAAKAKTATIGVGIQADRFGFVVVRGHRTVAMVAEVWVRPHDGPDDVDRALTVALRQLHDAGLIDRMELL